jgi:hypothetical protein
MNDAEKIDPTTVRPIRTMRRSDRPRDQEESIRGIEFWVLAMVVAVVLLVSVARML